MEVRRWCEAVGVEFGDVDHELRTPRPAFGDMGGHKKRRRGTRVVADEQLMLFVPGRSSPFRTRSIPVPRPAAELASEPKIPRGGANSSQTDGG